MRILASEMRNGFPSIDQGFSSMEQGFDKLERRVERVEDQAEKGFWQFWKVFGGVAGVSV